MHINDADADLSADFTPNFGISTKRHGKAEMTSVSILLNFRFVYLTSSLSLSVSSLALLPFHLIPSKIVYFKTLLYYWLPCFGRYSCTQPTNESVPSASYTDPDRTNERKRKKVNGEKRSLTESWTVKKKAYNFQRVNSFWLLFGLNVFVFSFLFSSFFTW